MNILIIEDEQIAADRLELRLKELNPEFRIVAKIGSVKQSIKWLQNHSADLIFLDIQLSDGLSFSIFEQVEIDTPIIFTTAYDQYAIKAFELNSVAYLLKPVRKDELERSLAKYDAMKSAFGLDIEDLLSDYLGKDSSGKKRFLVKLGEKFIKLEVTDVAFFYAMEKDVYARTFEGRNIPLDYTLDSLVKLLDTQMFFRINRKYIVNIDSIENMIALSRSRIKLDLNPAPLDRNDAIVSIQNSADFKKWMDG